MTIDEIIIRENEYAAEFQGTVDNHVNDNEYIIREMHCDDSVINTINEHLSLCKILADYHKQIADVLSKYQKIEEIYSDYLKYMNSDNLADRLGEVIEDGQDIIKD